jgi:hypothetical protein
MKNRWARLSFWQRGEAEAIAKAIRSRAWPDLQANDPVVRPNQWNRAIEAVRQMFVRLAQQHRDFDDEASAVDCDNYAVQVAALRIAASIPKPISPTSSTKSSTAISTEKSTRCSRGLLTSRAAQTRGLRTSVTIEQRLGGSHCGFRNSSE